MPDAPSKPNRWVIVLGILAGLLFAYWLRYVLLPFVAAGALTYIARPLLKVLQQKLNWPRWLAALVPFLLLLGLLAGASYGFDRTLAPQLAQMINNAPLVLEAFLRKVFRQDQITLVGETWTPARAANIILADLKQVAGANVLNLISGGFAAMMMAVLTVVLFGFFLFTGPSLARGVLWLLPPLWRPRAQSLAIQIDHMLARYLVGVFVIVLFTSAVTYIVTGVIFHVSHAILLSVAVGLLELFPVVGPILSFVTFGLVAIQEKGISMIIGFGVFAIVLRLSIDQLVGPLVLGRAVRIPAVVVIFAFLAGGALFGILGVVLAIPAAATIKIVLTNIYDGPPQVQVEG